MTPKYRFESHPSRYVGYGLLLRCIDVRLQAKRLRTFSASVRVLFGCVDMTVEGKKAFLVCSTQNIRELSEKYEKEVKRTTTSTVLLRNFCAILMLPRLQCFLLVACLLAFCAALIPEP